jgi:hypothetical protein
MVVRVDRFNMVMRVDRFNMVMMSRRLVVVSGRFTMMVKVAWLSWFFMVIIAWLRRLFMMDITRCHIHGKASPIVVMFSHISPLSRLLATISLSLLNVMQKHNIALLGTI